MEMFIGSTKLICCTTETNTSFVQHSVFPVPYSIHVVPNVARVIASIGCLIRVVSLFLLFTSSVPKKQQKRAKRRDERHMRFIKCSILTQEY
jgi:hypothetical protein